MTESNKSELRDYSFYINLAASLQAFCGLSPEEDKQRAQLGPSGYPARKKKLAFDAVLGGLARHVIGIAVSDYNDITAGEIIDNTETSKNIALMSDYGAILQMEHIFETGGMNPYLSWPIATIKTADREISEEIKKRQNIAIKSGYEPISKRRP